MPTRRLWTHEEDEQLRLLVSYWGDQCGKNGNWDRISQHFAHRSAKDCRKRWFHSLDPTLKRGRWTANEDKTLLEAREQLGPAWQRIAQLIPGRTDDQCAKRYMDVLDPNVRDRLRPWSKEEDEKLRELVHLYGSKWQRIAKDLEGRTGLTCRNRWRKLSRSSVSASPESPIVDAPGHVSTITAALSAAEAEGVPPKPPVGSQEVTYTVTLNPALPGAAQTEASRMHSALKEVDLENLFELAARYNRQVIVNQYVYTHEPPTQASSHLEPMIDDGDRAPPNGHQSALVSTSGIFGGQRWNKSSEIPPSEGGQTLVFELERRVAQQMLEEEQQMQAFQDPFDNLAFNPS